MTTTKKKSDVVIEEHGPVVHSTNTRVSVKLGYTHNLGNFQSVKVSVGMDDDRRPGEHPDEAFKRVKDWAEAKLVAEVRELVTEVESVTKDNKDGN